MADDLRAVREAYARRIVALADSRDAALIDAFAAVPRERFAGPAPWRIAGAGGGFEPRTDDPRRLYDDVLVALVPERGINNGQPSLHAQCLDALRLGHGDVVIHVGAGAGYYSAVLAELVGREGRVHAYEIEPGLAARARENLAPWPWVELHAESAVDAALPQGVDAIYVNACAPHPPDPWLDALALGGRMVLPLTAEAGSGAMLLLTRRTDERYAARLFARVAFIACIGAHDDGAASALAASLRARPTSEVRSLVRRAPPDASAWHVGRGWWLSTDPA
jgi:protein-L-isoaspartate(D-aspartate) O-methyltransferase